MPEIKLDRVVSVSSEDKKFPAVNLLGSAGSGKWKSASPGEKQLSVILQFKSQAQISSVHVGNEGSAFVEVLVGKETAASDQDWKVLLVASSLMTPADARSNTNLHKVRMFNSDSLSKSILEEKWDRAKVVCTQPFNKSQPFGLSFISFITDEENKTSGKSNSQKLGAYTLKEDTDSDEPSKKTGGSMFSDRARLQANIPPPTAAAAVRAAARDADVKVGVQKERNACKPASTKSEYKPIKRTASPATKEASKAKSKKQSPSPAIKPPTASKVDSPAPVPFKEIFKGVVFCLSGFKNPKRSDLREKAVEMGARYVGDWDKNCTHLVCAFTSTPKYGQVNGKGYIVTEDWVLDSHKRKKKLPWRDYRLGRAKSPPRANEDDEKEKAALTKSPAAADKEEEFSGSTDIDTDGEAADDGGQLEATQVDSDATEIDTDDEIAAHLATDDPPSKGKAPASGKPAIAKQSNGGTSKRTLPVLPDYLLDKVFFLYGNVKNRRSVYRFIHAYGGQVEEYMCDEVQYVITDDSWDDNFDSALTDNDSLKFVKSKWIMDIDSQQKFIPHQKYAIVPQ